MNAAKARGWRLNLTCLILLMSCAPCTCALFGTMLSACAVASGGVHPVWAPGSARLRKVFGFRQPFLIMP